MTSTSEGSPNALIEAFAMKKLVTAVDHNTKAVEQMVSLMRTNGGR